MIVKRNAQPRNAACAHAGSRIGRWAAFLSRACRATADDMRGRAAMYPRRGWVARPVRPGSRVMDGLEFVDAAGTDERVLPGPRGGASGRCGGS